MTRLERPGSACDDLSPNADSFLFQFYNRLYLRAFTSIQLATGQAGMTRTAKGAWDKISVTSLNIIYINKL